MSALLEVLNGMPKTAVVDLHAARVLGVMMAIGEKKSLDALCQAEDVVAKAFDRARGIGRGLSEDAVRWLAVGHQGASSQTLFQRLTGVQLTRTEAHPVDPSDFGRCRLLLEQVPWLEPRLQEAAEISHVWAKLVEAWEDLSKEMDKEAPRWREGVGSMPATYRCMKALGC
jgi:hypothetical protein